MTWSCGVSLSKSTPRVEHSLPPVAVPEEAKAELTTTSAPGSPPKGMTKVPASSGTVSVAGTVMLLGVWAETPEGSAARKWKAKTASSPTRARPRPRVRRWRSPGRRDPARRRAIAAPPPGSGGALPESGRALEGRVWALRARFSRSNILQSSFSQYVVVFIVAGQNKHDRGNYAHLRLARKGCHCEALAPRQSRPT